MVEAGAASVLHGRWRGEVVLKRDVFSTIERGYFRTDEGEVEAVLRRIDDVPWWSSALAHLLFRRERRALTQAAGLDVGPRLLFAGRHMLVRRWIAGVPLHIAKPEGDVGYFRSAKAALRKLHGAGVTHNDLAKEQNWLYADGRAYLTDFQLASCFPNRHGASSASRATRICAICSSTSAATRRQRSRLPSVGSSRARVC